MPNKKDEDYIQNNTSFWDRTKMAFTPGDVSDKIKGLKDVADENVRQQQLEAIRKKRMQTPGTGNGV